MSPAANSEKVASGVHNSPLPPSVEKAYYIKCVQLKRRIHEIEEGNAAGYLRKRRVSQAIHKLQMQQALLLEHLQRLTEDNIDDSDRSDSPPPTPQDKPLRSKRAHNRKSSPAPSGGGGGGGGGSGGAGGGERNEKAGSAQNAADNAQNTAANVTAAGESAAATPPSFAARPSSAVSTPEVQHTSYFGTPAGGANGTPQAGRSTAAEPESKREEDTEMGEAPPPPEETAGEGEAEGDGASGGFTAVNRD